MMDEAKVKGFMFQKSLEYVRKKLGKKVFEELGYNPEQFQPEKWYSFTDFCLLLARIDYMLSDYYTDNTFKLGYDMMSNDERWVNLFKGKDPREIFSTYKRQDAHVQIGEFITESVEEGRIKVKMELWTEDADHSRYWSEYYHGNFKAILDITGKKGTVGLHRDPKGQFNIYYYDVIWED
jgi:hypothetical protein